MATKKKIPLTPEEEAAKEARKKASREKTNKNLKPLNQRTPEERRAIQSKGGKAKGENMRARKAVREMMEDVFYASNSSGKGYGDSLIISVIIKGIKNGDPKVLELFRDTIDGKPIENLQIDGNPVSFYFDKYADKPSE